MKLILASGSPRRAELLKKMGLSFTVQPSNTEEVTQPGMTPQQEVMALSLQKAQAVYDTLPEEAVVLSADTIVVLDNYILGKPSDSEDAKKMLRALSGRRHLVLTGITVMGPNGTDTQYEETSVSFRTLSEQEIEHYVASGDPMDKAGSYGIQSAAMLFVDGLSGDYYNVMGLPVCRAGLMLRKAGIPVLGEVL